MGLEELGAFLVAVLARGERYWQKDALTAIAGLQVPDGLLGPRGTLLRADLSTLWARWFLEAVCDPDYFVVRPNLEYAHVHSRVWQRTHALFPSVPADERDSLARRLARLVDAEVQVRRAIGRTTVTPEQRDLLWDEYGPHPRCWLCGALFDEWAIDRFRKRDPVAPEPGLPAFVDFLRPRGLKRRDLRIEIDHVTPVTEGGALGENLRLACGWCNAHKSGRVSIYDVTGRADVFEHPALGSVSVPRPFWVVRLVAMRRRCEWAGGGCDRSLGNAELTVCADADEGAMNPVNLRVTCAAHDPLGARRLVARELWPRTAGYSA